MLEIAIEAAREAGALLKLHSGKARSIERKGGEETNLVTEIDRRSEKIIIDRIRRKYPQHDFLAEESGGRDRRSDYCWIIDPLDGTTNFTHGLPIFCVSIGLEHKGEIVGGVVYDPNHDELFTAEKGKGASLNRKRMHVSSTTRLIESLLVTGFPYTLRDEPDEIIHHFNNFLLEAQALRRLGSAALDLAYVAAGRFDGFWESSLHPWDMAAGVLLVQEAGGKFTDFDGNPSSVYKKALLTSNGLIHEQMIQVLRRGRIK
jgi:myo-inositol-1(or 4)-monophosphatase